MLAYFWEQTHRQGCQSTIFVDQNWILFFNDSFLHKIKTTISAIYYVSLLRLITNQNNVNDWQHIHQISQPEAAALTIKYKQSFLAIISMSKGRVHFRKKIFLLKSVFIYKRNMFDYSAHEKLISGAPVKWYNVYICFALLKFFNTTLIDLFILRD